MNRLTIALPVLAFILTTTTLPDLPASALPSPVGEIIWERVKAYQPPRSLQCRKELLCGSDLILDFYWKRDYRPARSNQTGLLPRARALIQEIRSAHKEGLRPQDYHLASIELLLEDLEQLEAEGHLPSPEKLALLDLLLTDAFFLYCSHLLTGRVNPETIYSAWTIRGRETDLGEVLSASIEPDQIHRAMVKPQPQHDGCIALKEALSRYIDVLRSRFATSPDPGSHRVESVGCRHLLPRRSDPPEFAFQSGRPHSSGCVL